MVINKCKAWNWKLEKYIMPKRVTSKGNQPIYQWLWFQIAFKNRR